MTSAFPESKVRTVLKGWWDSETGAHTGTGDPFKRPAASGGSVFDTVPTMDSLRAVTCLLTVEKILPFELPAETVRLGGYFDREDFFGHIIPSIKKQWDKHHTKKEREKVKA